jgi:outer membrane protein
VSVSKFKIILITILYVILFNNSVRSQEKITLQRAIDIALESNPTIKQALLSQKSSSIDLIQSKDALYPNLNAGTETNFNFARTTDPLTNLVLPENSLTFIGQLGTNITLFQGFQKLDQISENKFILEANKSNVQKLKNNLKLQVIATYLNIYQ